MGRLSRKPPLVELDRRPPRRADSRDATRRVFHQSRRIRAQTVDGSGDHPPARFLYAFLLPARPARGPRRACAALPLLQYRDGQADRARTRHDPCDDLRDPLRRSAAGRARRLHVLVAWLPVRRPLGRRDGNHFHHSGARLFRDLGSRHDLSRGGEPVGRRHHAWTLGRRRHIDRRQFGAPPARRRDAAPAHGARLRRHAGRPAALRAGGPDPRPPRLHHDDADAGILAPALGPRLAVETDAISRMRWKRAHIKVETTL
jgi:hypothetical protein